MGAPTPELPPTMPARAAGLARVELDGEAVVFDASHHRTHRLNPTAALVLDSCDGHTSTGDVCRALQARFGAELARITEDLAAVLADFARRQLVSTDSNRVEAAVPAPPLRAIVDDPAAVADGPVRARRFVTGPLRALDVSAIVTTDDQTLAEEVATRFGSLSSGSVTSGQDITTYELIDVARGIDVHADGRMIGNARGIDAALSLVQWHLNRLAAARADDRLQLHASAVRLSDGRDRDLPG